MVNILSKFFVLGLSFLVFWGCPTHPTEFSAFKENKDPQILKRQRDSSKIDSSQLKSKKQKLIDATERVPYTHKDRDKQFRVLSTQSKFIEGDNCAKLRWVEDLAIFCEGETPSDYIEISDDIHKNLAQLGNHLREFAALCPQNSRFPFQRNILIPHVSFVVKRSGGNSSYRKFIKGDYLNFDHDRYGNFAMAFISGHDSMPWKAIENYNQYRRTEDSDLPLVRVMAGKEVKQITGEDYDSQNQAGKANPLPCNAHTEEWFYTMLLARPEALLAQAKKVLLSRDKIIHIIFDFYSWYDVCRDCQNRFRTEYFRGNVQKKLEQVFRKEGYQFPKSAGILPIFRVSSYQKYHGDSLNDMVGAGGGSGAKCGFEAKVVSQAQIVLATRKNTGEFNSDRVRQNLSTYMVHKRKAPR